MNETSAILIENVDETANFSGSKAEINLGQDLSEIVSLDFALVGKIGNPEYGFRCDPKRASPIFKFIHDLILTLQGFRVYYHIARILSLIQFYAGHECTIGIILIPWLES